MSKHDERAAKALDEAKNDCGHAPTNRGIDRETAEEFCGDCGKLLTPYVDGLAGRFPGRKALELITPKLQEQHPNQMGQVVLHYVEPVAADEFNVLIGVTVNGVSEWQHWKVVRRDGTDAGATVEQVRSFKEKEQGA